MKNSGKSVILERVWGSTIYHIDDLTIDPAEVAPQYTKFRQLSEGTPIGEILPELKVGYIPFPEMSSEEI
jgi:hypothetical protein